MLQTVLRFKIVRSRLQTVLRSFETFPKPTNLIEITTTFVTNCHCHLTKDIHLATKETLCLEDVQQGVHLGPLSRLVQSPRFFDPIFGTEGKGK